MSSLPHKQIGVAVIRDRQGKILIDRRLDKGEMAGLWEFPGGKIEPGETVEACIAREIQEEINLQVEVGDRLILIEHDYPKFKVSLHVHWCSVLAGDPKPIECAEILWVNPNELGQYQFPEANQSIIEAIQSS
ncbi:DNA mismatch repair protein MutT [Picosynechococcus sp. PCC 7003]|uniref:8-oxo-dGTP diphosphatase MutT n=1 Tax=Picosynechococcus sp. PCC 7003 TaxID=374981 RepID=UPI00081076CF|nr:8-oxo-dGTP diphosphatase MutT [Picosynechococcus sp. PCC 7003]ANV82971.1 DNA mismatch repair protein MutT [Picosynechococcus sp. PCC 7003]